jgi:hypothetical protein
MSNDNYYVVIVPHADQAAQALTTARIAGHASRHEPAAHHHAAKAAAPSRAAASPSGSARPQSGGATRKRGAPPEAGAAPKNGARRGGAGQRVRTWSVVAGDQKYDVTDFGTCGYKIEHNGTIVWTGVLAGRGYDTHTTTLAADTLQEVLRLAYVGDQREAAKEGRSESPPPAPPSAEPKSETRAKPKGQAKPKTEGSEPADGAAPSAKPTGKPKAKRPAKAKASAPAPSPKAEHGAEPKAKGPAKRKAASPRNGPPTQRTPATPPSATSHAPAASPSVDDKKVLDALRKKFREEDASTAEENFTAFKRIWLGGGREATVEWMKHHTFPSAADAFIDWTNKHFEAAQAMLNNAPHSAAKSAKVA